ncbi:MAG: glycosyltransferase family 4 protein [Victivallales bacterium]|nr:glycosyltransferase family 4 protein [Victivallales bacterium]
MRIAHIIRRLSFADWGGTEQVVWNLARAQARAGHEVRILATDALCKTPHETVDGLDIFRFPAIYPWWPMGKRLIAELDRKGGNPFVPDLGRTLRAWKPDVIHCHAMGRIAELCLRTAEALRAPAVVSLHGGGAMVPTEEARSLRSPTRWLLPWGKLVDYLMGWVRKVPEDADGIVCVGEDEYEFWRERHSRVLHLPNGVDISLYAPAAAQHDGGRRADKADWLALCVARIDRQKNQLMLVEALARHPGMRVRLVGPVTQPDYREELERRARELGVAERLSFAGALKPNGEELVAEYANADAFVLPSRHEPFGIVALEAWAAHLPVIASRIGGLGRLCAAHPQAALSFGPGSAEELDAALARLRGDGALAQRLAKAGAEAVRGYDWGTLAGRLVDFYQELKREE